MEENQRRKAFYEQLGLPAPAIEQLEMVEKTFDTRQMQESIERLTDRRIDRAGGLSTAAGKTARGRGRLEDAAVSAGSVGPLSEKLSEAGNRRGNFCGHHALLFPIHSGMLRDERQVCL